MPRTKTGATKVRGVDVNPGVSDTFRVHPTSRKKGEPTGETRGGFPLYIHSDQNPPKKGLLARLVHWFYVHSDQDPPRKGKEPS